jgi:hypothetical protein
MTTVSVAMKNLVTVGNRLLVTISGGGWQSVLFMTDSNGNVFTRVKKNKWEARNIVGGSREVVTVTFSSPVKGVRVRVFEKLP